MAPDLDLQRRLAQVALAFEVQLLSATPAPNVDDIAARNGDLRDIAIEFIEAGFAGPLPDGCDRVGAAGVDNGRFMEKGHPLRRKAHHGGPASGDDHHQREESEKDSGFEKSKVLFEHV